MKRIEDEFLRGVVHGIIVGRAQRMGNVFLIDRHYQCREVFTVVGEFSQRQATRAREEMLRNGVLLAVVATGLHAGSDPGAVCEYHPKPGRVETYTLSWPMPTVSWTDPDSEASQAVIESYQWLWK